MANSWWDIIRLDVGHGHHSGQYQSFSFTGSSAWGTAHSWWTIIRLEWDMATIQVSI